jgi:hypothetical protein
MTYDISVTTRQVTLTTTSSDIADCNGYAVSLIIIPADMMGTALTFSVSLDDVKSIGATFYALKDNNNAVISIPISNTAAAYTLTQIMPFSIGGLKIASNSTSDANKVITIVTQKVL